MHKNFLELKEYLLIINITKTVFAYLQEKLLEVNKAEGYAIWVA